MWSSLQTINHQRSSVLTLVLIVQQVFIKHTQITGRRQNKIKYSNSRHLYSLLLYTRRPCCCSTTRTHRTNPDGKNCLCLYCWRSVVPKKLLTHPTKSEGDGRRSDTSINSKQQKLPDSSAKLTAAPKKRCCPRDHTVLLSCWRPEHGFRSNLIRTGIAPIGSSTPEWTWCHMYVHLQIIPSLGTTERYLCC